MRVVRAGDIILGPDHRGGKVEKAYFDMIKFESGSQMWIDAGLLIEGWTHEDGTLAVAPPTDTAKARPLRPGQTLRHKTNRSLFWSTGPEVLPPANLGEFTHEDGTPISIGFDSLVIDGTTYSTYARVPDHKARRAECQALISASINESLMRRGTIITTAARIAQRLFNADPRVKEAMSKLEAPQFEKAYARGIFGYQPEVTYAQAAWSLAEEITK